MSAKSGCKMKQPAFYLGNVGYKLRSGNPRPVNYSGAKRRTVEQPTTVGCDVRAFDIVQMRPAIPSKGNSQPLHSEQRDGPNDVSQREAIAANPGTSVTQPLLQTSHCGDHFTDRSSHLHWCVNEISTSLFLGYLGVESRNELGVIRCKFPRTSDLGDLSVVNPRHALLKPLWPEVSVGMRAI